MKSFILAALALVAFAIPAEAITVTTPANGAQLTSPFTLVASTTTCGSVPAVSMGYSIDNDQAIIVSTSFSAQVSASVGTHVLHVKCWGQQTSDEVLLNITVVPPGSNITVAAPANGAQLTSPFNLSASVSTCDSVSAVSMGYSLDNGQATIEPTSFTAQVSASVGTHILHVKCWGQQVSDEKLLTITVVPPTSDITVASPANGAQVTSLFNVSASATSCASTPAVSMGYSLDNEQATIEPTSFTAQVSASVGTHILHVKCWGQQVSDEKLLTITVVPPTSDITVASPANGAQVTSSFNLSASVTSCASTPAVSMGYSLDNGQATIEPTSFSVPVTASVGTHILHVKCWGQQVSDEKLLSITVIQPVTATPVFSLPAGKYTGGQSVAVSVPTAGAAIYYTLDGSAPTTASLQYAGPIPVAKTAVIEAMAVAPGYVNSGLARADYQISAPGPSIPANAISSQGVQTLANWNITHDPGTPGTSTGAMTLVSDPALSGQAAEFDTSFTYWGGELYSKAYATDANAQNFVYDAQVWVEAGSTLGNLEMDNNQVMANGDTVIFGFQCAGDTNSWDYTENAGTPTAPAPQWVQSNQPCNPESWTPDTWHHIQVSYSRDDAGNVTYHSVWLDGVESPINVTVPSDFTLGWASGTLLTNFQVDGLGSGGSSTLYLDNLTIYRW